MTDSVILEMNRAPESSEGPSGTDHMPDANNPWTGFVCSFKSMSFSEEKEQNIEGIPIGHMVSSPLFGNVSLSALHSLSKNGMAEAIIPNSIFEVSVKHVTCL